MSAEYAEEEDGLIGVVVQDRFKVLRRLAQGGMGVVYEAEQVPLGRKVALKILEIQKAPASDQSFRERFFLEASAAAKLAHPNTIVVHDYGKTDDGLYFIAMEYLDGGTLSKRIKGDGPLAPVQAIHVGLQIASSLRDAHEQGLVHRDLKPGNVMFTPRGGDPLFIKVLDFGLVKVVAGEGQENLNLTQSGVMMGSPRYMAPEQVKAQACDARTDIYSFGAVLHHMLTGAPPFHAGSTFEAMQHHVYTPPPTLRQTWPGCPAGPRLEQAVLKCLQKEPEQRFQSMDALMEALREAAVEAGGGLSGVGSYLGTSGSSPGDSGSDRAAPSATPSPASVAPPPSMSGQQGASGIVSRSAVDSTPDQAAVAPHAPSSRPPGPETQARMQKTMRFSNMPDYQPPSNGGAVAQPVAQPMVQAPSRSSGAKIGIVLAALAAVFLAGGIAVLVVLFAPLPATQPSGSTPEPSPEPTPEPTPEALPEPTPAVATPEPAPTPAPEVPAAVEIPALSLQTDPTGATVRRDGSDMGDAPLDLRIPAGERWTLQISLDGYEPRTVVVQGGQRSLTVQLEPLEPERPRPSSYPRPSQPLRPVIRPLGGGTPTPRTPPPTTRRGRGSYTPDLDDPWAR